MRSLNHLVGVDMAKYRTIERDVDAERVDIEDSYYIERFCDEFKIFHYIDRDSEVLVCNDGGERFELIDGDYLVVKGGIASRMSCTAFTSLYREV